MLDQDRDCNEAPLPAASELFIVDDDANIRAALSAVFATDNFRVTGFADGNSFLSAARVRTPACVLLDLHMPGRSGLDILKELDAHHYGAPVFIISAQGDIPIAVEAIKNGAFDFIEKPFVPEAMIARVREALDARKHHGDGNGGRLPEFPGSRLLTPRECEVLVQISGGASNKEAGRKLGISPRTIEVHRARIMVKLGAKNAADLVRIVLSAERPAASDPRFRNSRAG
jgi:two-component system, LuxR family, response regulator FixJ